MPAAPSDHTASTPVDPSAGSMTAIVHDAYDTEPERALRLAEVDKPAISADEVLVRVRAASVDRGTWHVMAGLPYPVRLAGFGARAPKHLNPGRSLAGTVEAVGSGVHGFAPGDDVYGITPGSLAEYAAVSPGKLAAKPAALSFEEAATVPISGLTALQAVRDRGRVRAGQRVLVIGASGGVGSFAVQIAKAQGAEVTGVCHGAKADLVASLGADRVIDHTREDIDDAPRDGDQRPYDVILDIGGNRPLSVLRRVLAQEGTLVIVGGETGGRWLGGNDRQLRAQLLSPLVKQRLTTFVNSENAGDLVALGELIDSGAVTPAIDRVYPLAETAAAISHVVDGRARGKVVVTVGGEDRG